MTTLDDLIKQGGDHAHDILLTKRLPSLLPMYHIVCPSGDIVLGCSWNNAREKELCIVAARSAAALQGATAIMFLGESWLAPYPSIDPPSQSPSRREYVIALATDGAQTKGAGWFIKRDAAQKIVALDKDEVVSGSLVGFSGQLIDGILPIKQTKH